MFHRSLPFSFNRIRTFRQKNIRYLKNLQFFLRPYLTPSDDGYSGTNFDRPAFRRMIGDIETGVINMVLIKDLSRLGRDYILAGQYTELYFPEHHVRCIAVNDGYDSEKPGNDLMPFQHVINEMYARDISKKIRAAFSVKMREISAM